MSLGQKIMEEIKRIGIVALYFAGPSGRGFAIEGWYQNGRINAAYPLGGP